VARAVDVYALDGKYGDVSLVGLSAVGILHDRFGVLGALLADQIGAGGGARGSGLGTGPLDQGVVIVELIVGELEDDRASDIDIGRNLIQVDNVAIGNQQRLRPELLRPAA